MIAELKPSSIQLGCMLCDLFSEYFATLPAHRTRAEMTLLAHHHTEDYDMVSHSIYVNNSGTGYERQFWLFPMEQPQTPRYGVLYSTARPVAADRADITLTRSWLEECRAKHQSELNHCTPVTLRLKMPLKVIDCQTRQVRALHKHESHVCLSYMWGKTTFKKTLDGLRIPEMIGKTIKDAMYVSRQLRVPRLWVDQYCIDQQNTV